jgi:hypothetical protein
MTEAQTPFLNQMYQTGMQGMQNASNMANQLWQGERNLQMGTASQAPGWALQAGQLQTGAIDPMIALQQQGLRNYGALSGVGETQQGYNQMLMDTANNAVYEPFEAGIGRVLGPLMGLATAQTGSSTSATGPNMAPSPLSQALGAGTGMASMYALLSGLGRA